MIIFSDLHLSEDSAETVFGQVLPGVTAAAVQDGGNLACLGDFWHVRYRVPVALQNQVHRWLMLLRQAGVTLRLLPGNHDQINEGGENALEVFTGLSNVHVYTEPTLDAYGYWVPYRKLATDIEAALNVVQSNGKSVRGGTLFMHHGIQGAKMNDAKVDTEGLPITMFHGYTMVLCGHYHKQQNVGRTLFYVGSPYQVKADESGQPKGYVKWDGRKVQYVQTQWGKRYFNLVMESPAQQLDLSMIKPGDEVRVTTKAGVNPELVGRMLQNSGITNHVVMPEVEAPQSRLKVGANATLIDYARAYVGERASGQDADRLWRVFQDITGAQS